MSTPKIYAAPRQWITTAIFVLVGMVLAYAANVLYTNRVDRESNQAWCDIINGLVKRNSVIERPDADTLEFRQQLANLQKKYECLTK